MDTNSNPASTNPNTADAHVGTDDSSTTTDDDSTITTDDASTTDDATTSARSRSFTTRTTPTSDTPTTTEVALVLGAGGPSAEAWHAGVTRALHEETGWDARSAALIVGTSAGAIIGLGLRAGIPPSDLHALKKGEPCSREGQKILDRIVTEHSEGRRGSDERSWGAEWLPQAPVLAARALWPPWQVRPVHAAMGLLPSGDRTTDALEQWLTEMHPGTWPQERFWVPAVRLDDGRRVVFGRDDVQATAAQAVRASCAVPSMHEPVTVNGKRYVDGGIHSATNADLAGPPDFDAVVVSSVMSGAAGWSEVREGLRGAWSQVQTGIDKLGSAGSASDSAKGREWWREAWSQAWNDGRAIRAARRQRMSTTLRREVDALRCGGTAVLVVEPDAAAVELMDSTDARYRHRDREESPDLSIKGHPKPPQDDHTADSTRSTHTVNDDHTAELTDISTPTSGIGEPAAVNDDHTAELTDMADAVTRQQLRTRHGARFAALLHQAAAQIAEKT